MGKNQKIPYINEVLFYLLKTIVLFLILNYLMAKTSLYNAYLLLIFSIFCAFCFNILYLISISLSYLIFFFIISGLKSDNFGLLILYSFAVALNTLCMIIFLKFKYKFKEED